MPDGPLRLCIVSTFYPPYNFGGDGIYAHRLANGLAREGHRVTVLHSPTAYEMLAGGAPADPYDDLPEVRVQPVRTPLGALGLLYVHQVGRPGPQASELRRWLERESYDVIHYNNVSLLGGPGVFRLGHAPLKLCTLIDHWLVCPMHALWKLGREVCSRPTCLRCTVAGNRPPQLWRSAGLRDRATRHIDAFLGPSLFTIRMHHERGLRGTMVQLPLLHRESDSTPIGTRGPDRARPYFLFVGRLERMKGVQVLLPVFRELAGVDLLIAGTGPFEAELRARASGVRNVEFLGRCDQSRLRELYRHAIATIVPSLCYETFGLIVAESFAQSTPVVLHAQSSLEEIIDRHGGGLMYRTASELRDALERLRLEHGLRDRLGREGRRAYEQEFAEEPFLRHYVELVRELLVRKAAGETRTSSSTAGTSIAGRPAFFFGDR
jgi:glycosyltransferase involved in cell wall biosynthesis